MTIGLGISMGYHRLHTHRSYQVPLWLEYFFAVCGAMTLEGGPIFWVATHRIHHQKSDQPGDPHSPRDGGWWAHVGWILLGEAKHNNTRMMCQIRARPGQASLLRLAEQLSLGAEPGPGRRCCSPSAASRCSCGASACASVIGLHATWLVNSATHMWGYRRFETRDDSRNTWWVALMTLRRRLAQQSPRASDFGAPRPGLVRVRPDLAAHQGAEGLRHRQGDQGGFSEQPPGPDREAA